jgi:hypothetical protein
MTFLLATAKSSAATHYSWYAAFALGAAVVLWIAQRYFGAFFDRLGSESAPVLLKGLGRGHLGGARLRKYRRVVQENFSGHALGFGGAAPIDIRQVYVPLTYETAGRREDVYARIRAEHRSVVIGPAGAGKSLLLKNSMLIWAEGLSKRHGNRRDRRVPVLIELHRCNNSDGDITQLVLEELDRNQVSRPRSFVGKALRDGQLRLLLDGLDEVGKDRREQVIKMIMDFAKANSACQIVVTCRDAIYHGELSERFEHVVRIADFDDASIRRFLGNWPGIERADVDGLSASLRSNPSLMHLARSPLLLTMIAYLYVNKFAKKSRSLPASRATFYETAINHLLDRDRELARAGALSIYETSEKLPVLQRIALTVQQSAIGIDDRTEISYTSALAVTQGVLPNVNLDESHAKPLFTEIVDRSQLLIPLDQRRTEFTFRHLTLQEFLAARELADRPGELLAGYRNDPDGWREVVKLWCGGIRDCTRVVHEVLSWGTPQQQVLALECLAEARHIEDKYAGDVIDWFFQRLRHPDDQEQALITAFGALAASGGPRGERVLRELIGMTTSPYSSLRAAACQALSASGRQEAAAVLAPMAARDDEARVALRAMGELAIPVLTERAATGSEQAVDDLGVIATPAAAEALAGLLHARLRVAVKAAWLLAGLLTNPDVEEGLRRSRYQMPGKVQSTYNWIWQPFTRPGAQDGPLGSIVARLAYVINAQPDYVPNSNTEIDPRIAIPLAGLAIKARLQEEGYPVQHRLKRNMMIPREGEAHFIALSRRSPTSLSRTMRADVAAVLNELDLKRGHRALIERLPWPVMTRLLATVFGTRIISTGQRDWQNVWAASKSGKALWVAFWTLLSLGVLTPTVFAIYCQIETIKGVWHFWPADANWLLLSAFFGTISVTVLGFIFRNRFTFKIDPDTVFGLALLIAVAIIITDILESSVALSAWAGWAVVGPTLTGVICGPSLLGLLAARRDRRYRNPLRACLLASGQYFADRTSVIR